MLSQQLLSQRIPWEGGARRPKGDGRREGSRGAAKETATPPRPRRAGGEYVLSIVVVSLETTIICNPPGSSKIIIQS